MENNAAASGTTRRTRAALLTTMGSVYYELGLYGQAERLYQEALQVRRGFLPADDPLVAETPSIAPAWRS